MQKTAIPFDARARSRGLTLVLALVGLALALSALLPALAAAARPASLIQFPGDGAAGTAAGKMNFPRSIAASPVNGDLYVADDINNRIDEYTAWGTFVRAFGWGVKSGDTAATGLDACTAATGCQQGFTGSAPGQFGSGFGNGIEVDSVGDVYVTDMLGSHRVLKFGPMGEFLLMFGGEVDHTTGADVCTKEDIEVDGDTCGAGVEGTGNGEFPHFTSTLGDHLAVGPDDTVYVGEKERIQEFEPDGTFKGLITFKALHEELADFPENTYAMGLAADPASGDLYFIAGTDFSNEAVDKRVFRIDPESGELVGVLTAPTLTIPTALAVDSAGDVYVVDKGLTVGVNNSSASILEFDASGAQLVPDVTEKEAIEKEKEAKSKSEPFEHFKLFGEPPAGNAIQLLGIATDAACESESDDLYATYVLQPSIAYVNAFGPAPQNALKCPPPPPVAPEIGAQYATSVATDAATVQAEISPGYDVSTTYRVQYGVGKCSEGGCGEEKPLAPGAKLTSKIGKTVLKTAAVFLSDLAPGTTYHYRFVAENAAGTVRGVGGEVGADGEEASFTTFPTPGRPKEDCAANQVFRVGPSAQLTDCRAYELVSPARRTPTGDIVTGLSPTGFLAELNQSAADGERLAYSSRLAFGDSLGAPFISEYIATRHAGEAWSTHAISPPRESTAINTNAIFKFDMEEKAFTEDLCTGWLAHNADPPLGVGAIEGFPNLYKRDNCGAAADSYEAATSVMPPSTEEREYYPELQGFSTDGSRTVFRANAKLTGEAPELPTFANRQELLYEQSEGGLHYLCVLPDGTPWGAICSAGTTHLACCEGRTNSVLGAVSADARRVYWTAEGTSEEGTSKANTDGRLYLRENSDQDQSAIEAEECTEPEKACSFKVSNAPAQFWAAASDGSLALYTEGEKLREFDAVTKKSKTIAAEAVRGVAASSQDLSVFYFVSTKKIGSEGQEGKPNLYRDEEGAVSLVATLSEKDPKDPLTLPLGPATQSLTGKGARSTGDGQHLLFASSAHLTAYDNSDAQTGEPASEIYLYDADSAGPVCISCNPSGARPSGRTLADEAARPRVAALLPVALTQLFTPRAITEDGNRVFFNSFDALVARDTNGKEDVYEWERTSGQEECKELGADLYVESSGGCLSLISSGESAQDSTFVDSSIATGARDVFFKTGSSLIHEDTGLIDIYDAREGGGLPETPPTPPSCEGEACQGPAEPPNDPTPASAAFQGAGNVNEPAASKCSTGKVRRKGRCAAKRHKHAHSRTNRNRRTAK